MPFSFRCRDQRLGLEFRRWLRPRHFSSRFAFTGPTLDDSSMSIPETPEGRLAHHRLVIALDAAMRHLVIQIGGPKFGPGLAKVLESPEALDGPYGFQLSRMADDFFAGCPEIEELLLRDDWEDTVLPLLQLSASDGMNRQISPGELEELHSTVEAMAVCD